MASRPNQQRAGRPQSQRGDFTGRQKEQLAAEAETAVAARREELGMITAAQDRVRDEGVVDITGDGDPQLELEGLEDTAINSRGEIQPDPEPEIGPEGTRLGGSQSKLDVFELPTEIDPAGVQPGVAVTRDTANDPILIRAEFDMEQTTLGVGNTYDFAAGQRYRVPRWVAQHFADKGLCSVLSAG